MQIDRNSQTWIAVKEYVQEKADDLASEILSRGGFDHTKDEIRRSVLWALVDLVTNLEKAK